MRLILIILFLITVSFADKNISLTLLSGISFSGGLGEYVDEIASSANLRKKFKPCATILPLVNFYINPNASISTGVLLNQKGYRFEISERTGMQFSHLYLGLPLYINFNSRYYSPEFMQSSFSSKNREIGFNVSIGASISYLLDASRNSYSNGEYGAGMDMKKDNIFFYNETGDVVTVRGNEYLRKYLLDFSIGLSSKVKITEAVNFIISGSYSISPTNIIHLSDINYAEIESIGINPDEAKDFLNLRFNSININAGFEFNRR